MNECLDKNMIDKDEYPQMAELESRCVDMLADLWSSPDAANTLGCSTTGSRDSQKQKRIIYKSASLLTSTRSVLARATSNEHICKWLRRGISPRHIQGP